jgi:hypothetical protein
MIDVKKNNTNLTDESLIEMSLAGGAYGTLQGMDMIRAEFQDLIMDMQERVGRWRIWFYDNTDRGIVASLYITYDDERLLAKTTEVQRDDLLNKLGI